MGPEESTSLFEAGGTAMYFMGAWDAGRFAQSDFGDMVGVFCLPAYDPQYNNISVGSVDTSFALSQNCQNVDAAVDFLKFWTSETNELNLLYNAGRIPSGVYEVDETKVHPLMAEVLKISSQQVGLTPWWDRQFGAGEGVEFNNTCVAVLGGEDAQSAFDALQQFAIDNADR